MSLFGDSLNSIKTHNILIINNIIKWQEYCVYRVSIIGNHRHDAQKNKRQNGLFLLSGMQHHRLQAAHHPEETTDPKRFDA
jgi:hypothetical protein